MSARRPAPSLRERSVFDGLDRRVVTSGDLVAHSVAVICPSASALSTSFSLPHVVGPGAWLSVVVGVGLSWLLARAFGEFGSRFVAPGSLYTYAAKGLGATVALFVGCSMLLGYGALIGYGFADANRQTGRAWEALGGDPPGVAAGVGVVVGSALLCVWVMRRGIRWSSRFAFTTEAVALTTLAVVLLVTASRYGVSLGSALSLEGADPTRVLTGAAMIMTVTVGFESCAALGVEARRPFLEVPRAMRVSVLLTGGLILAGVIASSGLQERLRGRWFSPGAAVSPVDGLVLLIIAASYVALALCAWTALVRLLFALSREGILPPALGRTDRRTGIPTVGIVVTFPVLIVVPVWGLLDHETALPPYDLLVAATVTLFVAYGTTALAVVPFLARLRELTARTVAVALAATGGTALMTWVELTNDLADGDHLVLTTLAVVLAVAVSWWLFLVLRRPRAIAQVGTHEEPLASDVLLVDVPRS